jgi:alpha-1,4-digalacturonate transport system substrate-binding protein
MNFLIKTILAFGMSLAASTAVMAQNVELRVTWYNDGNEGEVFRDLLDRFEKSNPNIKVKLDTVPFTAIQQQLPPLLNSGQGPDLARVVDLGGLSKHYLDVRPNLKDARYFDSNFGETMAFLELCRSYHLRYRLSIPPFFSKLVWHCRDRLQLGMIGPKLVAKWLKK